MHIGFDPFRSLDSSEKRNILLPITGEVDEASERSATHLPTVD